MQELFIKKRRKSIEIMDKCPKYENNGYLDALHEKRKR
jgi:hypothetical protein